MLPRPADCMCIALLDLTVTLSLSCGAGHSSAGRLPVCTLTDKIRQASHLEALAGGELGAVGVHPAARQRPLLARLVALHRHAVQIGRPRHHLRKEVSCFVQCRSDSPSNGPASRVDDRDITCVTSPKISSRLFHVRPFDSEGVYISSRRGAVDSKDGSTPGLRPNCGTPSSCQRPAAAAHASSTCHRRSSSPDAGSARSADIAAGFALSTRPSFLANRLHLLHGLLDALVVVQLVDQRHRILRHVLGVPHRPGLQRNHPHLLSVTPHGRRRCQLLSGPSGPGSTARAPAAPTQHRDCCYINSSEQPEAPARVRVPRQLACRTARQGESAETCHNVTGAWPVCRHSCFVRCTHIEAVDGQAGDAAGLVLAEQRVDPGGCGIGVHDHIKQLVAGGDLHRCVQLVRALEQVDDRPVDAPAKNIASN